MDTNVIQNLSLSQREMLYERLAESCLEDMTERQKDDALFSYFYEDMEMKTAEDLSEMNENRGIKMMDILDRH